MSKSSQSNESKIKNKAGTFSIANLLALTTVVGTLLIPVSIWGAEGIGASVILVCMILMGWGLWNAQIGLIGKTVCGIGLLGILIGMLLPPATRYRVTGPRTICINNMRQLVLACHNYESANGTFPPPFSVDDQGQPLHSWRVLILPYIEEQSLYDDLDLTKPWNDPVNIKHAHRMPDLFICAGEGPTPAGRFAAVKTPYVAIIGKETIWDPTAGGLSWNDVTDGSSNTIMILETNVRPVHWMSPTDISFDEIVAVNAKGETDLISSHHAGGANAALVDGSSHFVPETTTVAKLKAALTIKGGEVIDMTQ